MSEPVEISPTPSEEWTTEERIAVAAKLASELLELAYKGFLPRGTAIETCERICYILIESPVFLEDNREAILKGQAAFRPNNPERH